jgi:cytochrome c oxidase cbb3-type subunit I/II
MRTNGNKLPVLAACVAIAGVAGLGALPVLAQTRSAAPLVSAEAKAIYARECAMCHGTKGDGEGPGSHIVNPTPRNFTTGVFKFRSTPSGQPPTDGDLFKTITNGIPGTAMPSFRELSERARWTLVAVVKQLAGIKKAGAAVNVPPEPAVRADRFARGKEIYDRLGCAECHGMEGRADGASSLTLKDDAKHRIWAVDLTRDIFKGGSTPRDLYIRIVTGIDGSPMPSYATNATSDEIWALVQYVQSLAQPRSAGREK